MQACDNREQAAGMQCLLSGCTACQVACTHATHQALPPRPFAWLVVRHWCDFQLCQGRCPWCLTFSGVTLA